MWPGLARMNSVNPSLRNGRASAVKKSRPWPFCPPEALPAWLAGPSVCPLTYSNHVNRQLRGPCRPWIFCAICCGPKVGRPSFEGCVQPWFEPFQPMQPVSTVSGRTSDDNVLIPTLFIQFLCSTCLYRIFLQEWNAHAMLWAFWMPRDKRSLAHARAATLYCLHTFTHRRNENLMMILEHCMNEHI